MKFFNTFSILGALFFSISTHFAYGQTSPPAPIVLTDFTDTLQEVSQIYKARYALADYKNQMFQWDQDQIVQDLLARAQQDPQLTTRKAQKMLQEFFNSTRDYHAQAYFANQPYITLPIGMYATQGRLFISYVDVNYKGPIQVGDEVMTYDQKSAMTILSEMTTPIYPNFSGTDLRDATRRLTARYGMLMDTMPTQADLPLSLVHADGVSYTETLTWKGFVAMPTSFKATSRAKSPIPENLQGLLLDDPYGYSSRKSYFPRPDQLTWEAADSDLFYAWIAPLNNKRIGLIRIPSFSFSEQKYYAAAVQAFKNLVNKMNAETDTLIIDVQGNRGGMLDYGEALASFFFDSPKEAYKFQYKLFPGLVGSLQTSLAQLNALKTQADAVAYFGADHYFGYPLDLDFVNDMKAMYQGLLDDSALGTLAQPRYYNAAQVKPYPGSTPYLKPLFIMTDAWSVSCGDWFPAFMQDHKRATIIGTRTAGGGAFTGGSVALKVNSMQLKSIVAPIALMYRLDGSKIENKGVTPDYILAPTADDLKDGLYKQYKQDLFQLIERLLTP